MKILLNNCQNYADQWKIEFNSNKSLSSSINCVTKIEFYLNRSVIPTVNSLIYLGLPIGDDKFTFEFFENKFKSVQKSLFSLRGICFPSIGQILERLPLLINNFVNQ